MLQCCKVAMLQCCNVTMLQCCKVAMLQCCNVTMLRCCDVALLRCCVFLLNKVPKKKTTLKIWKYIILSDKDALLSDFFCIFANDNQTENIMKKNILLTLLFAMLTITGAQAQEIYDNITLDENVDNSATIAEYDGKTCDVNLKRSIIKGMYNTLSLPFDVDRQTFEETFGEDAELATLNGSHYEGEDVIFEFENVNEYGIFAGWPYLIYVKKDVNNPSFTGVTISSQEITIKTAHAEFIPVLNPSPLDNGNKNLLFLGTNNALYYPEINGGNIRGMRAYFYLKEYGKKANAIIRMIETPTGVRTINEQPKDNTIYDLQGRKVNHPTRGIYIVNGKKVFIR